MKTVIMAGGKGTRMGDAVANVPKPMVLIAGKPILEHELICLRNQGFKDIIITVSHMGKQIIDYFGDGKKFGVCIEYYNEDSPLGNAGALFKIRHKLKEPFLLLNADLMLDVDFQRFVNHHFLKGGVATLLTHPNCHPYDSGIIIADEDGSVVKWIAKEDDKPEWYKNRVNAGVHIIDPKLLDEIKIPESALDSKNKHQKVDLDRDILKPMCGTKRIYIYDSPEYVKDMGTPERYQTVCRDYETGIVQGKSLRNKQKAVFLDRDGTINKYVGFLKNIDDFELCPGVAEAIKRINDAGYLTIVITNQPVIARGEVTTQQLEEIHNKMETLLGQQGAYVDAIFYCPHHTDKGFDGEIIELKVECDCRKPKPGLFLKAADKYNIDLRNSWMVGDGENDVKAGLAAGCKTALLGENNYGQTMSVQTVLEFVEAII